MALTIVLAYLVLFFLSLFLLLSNLIPSRKPAAPKLPPGPRKLPIIGNLHRLGKLPHRSLHELSQEHGPLMFLKLGSIPTVVASSADAAKEFLKTHDLDSCSRPALTSAAKLSYGYSDVGFAPYGPEWRELRKICIVEFFSSKRVMMFQSIREEEVQRMINNISSKPNVNLSATMLSLSNDITCRQGRIHVVGRDGLQSNKKKFYFFYVFIIFFPYKLIHDQSSPVQVGLNFCFLCRSALGKRYYNDEATDETNRVHEILVETQAVLGGFFFTDYIPALGWLDVLTGMRTRLQKNFSNLDSFYETVIQEHMYLTTTTTTSTMEQLRQRGEDTMDALLRIQKDANDITKENVKAILMNIFLGGSDTSSTVVEWAMTELMRNPRVMKKAQDEVRDLVGMKGKVEESELPRLNYLKCVVKEVMRLHAPVPLLVHRETMQPFKINGFDIPAGTRVMVNAWAIGRDQRSWEKPEEFIPERFVDKPIDMKGHDFELIPFGAGRRICPGMHIGLVLIELALANLLYSFDWGLPEGIMSKEEINMEEAIGVTVRRKSPLRLIATKWSSV